MDSETNRNQNGDEDKDGIPAEVIRELIRRSLETAQPTSDFFRFSSIDLDPTLPPFSFVPQGSETGDEIGPPVKQRVLDGLSTGFRDFDRVIGGLRKGELVTVAGLPSSGLSTFVQNVVRRSITDKPNTVVAFYNLDSTRQQIVQRLLAAEARIDWHSATAGLLRDDEWKRLGEAVQRLWNGKLSIDDDRFVTLDDIYDNCAQKKRGIGLDLIVLDRVNVLGSDFGGETPPLGETMADLKTLAEALEMPVLLTCTVDPKQADEETHRLSVRSLPSAIQLYSDVLTLLHRPDQWNAYDTAMDIPEPQKGLEVVELNIARQVGGSSEIIRFGLNTRWGRFENVLWD
jgi:replicative DNA helicase